MLIKLITVGKIKEKYFRDAIDEYAKRITKYSKIEIIELNDSNLSDTLAVNKEGFDILKHISKNDYIITLSINGKEVNSIELANTIDNILNTNSTITFIIGGSYGISDDVRKISNLDISFSKLTFPHKLFRVILLEQIYRSFKILNNESYHK